jgi:hypothetical protein
MPKAVVVVLVGVLLAGAWLALAAGTADAVVPEDGRVQEAAAVHAVQETVTREVDAPADRHEVAIAVRPEPVCTLRGRCVDTTGAPIGGVIAVLQGEGLPLSVRNATSADDGTFDLRTQPVARPFSLSFGGRVLPGPALHWRELHGGTMELGDIVLQRGTKVRGRVIGADGVPAAGVSLQIDDWNRKRDEDRSRRSQQVTAQDGTFAFQQVLPPGDYGVDVDDAVVASPDRITLAGEAERWVDVVLRPVTAADAIAGVVVDQSGDAVPGVQVIPMTGNVWRVPRSDQDGRFRLVRWRGAPDAVYLHLQAEGIEAPPPREEIAWGRDDLRFVVQRGLVLELQVVKASDGTPVEHYTLRVEPVRTAGFSTNDLKPRAGTHRVQVRPEDPDLGIGVAPVELTGAQPTRVVVRLASTRAGCVQVQRRDGSPVVGARVQLVHATDGELTLASAARLLTDSMQLRVEEVLLLDAATTDAHGEVTLRVPSDRSSGLLLPGPTHAPEVLPVAVFPAAGPLVVTVRDGAVLRGSVGPPEVLLQLAHMDLLPGHVMQPRVFLVGAEPQLPRDFPGNHSVFLAEDGAFEIVGAPLGRWRVWVGWVDKNGNRVEQEPAGEVTLEAGVTTTLAVDLSALLPGELEAQVFLNGKPLADQSVGLRAQVGADVDGEPRASGAYLSTDAEGRGRASLRPGDYELRWARSGPQPHRPVLRARERATVVRGEVTRQTFWLESGVARLRLLDAAGAPAAGVGLWLLDAGQQRIFVPATDAAGALQAECDAGTYTVTVLPQWLQDAARRSAFLRDHAGEADPTASVRIPLGTFDLRMGETIEFELRLPTDW